MRRRAYWAHLIQLGFVAIVAAAWYWSTATGSVSKLFLPAPAAVWFALSQLVVTRQFWSAVRSDAHDDRPGLCDRGRRRNSGGLC